LRYYTTASFATYNSSSPDKFLVGAGLEPADPATIEPPNDIRKAIWELKFDTVWAAAGTFEIDSTTVGSLYAAFVNTEPQTLTVNFLESFIDVPPAPKGDLNWDLALTAADVVLELNCIFCSDCPPPSVGTSACDMNCDGMSSPADVVLELYAVFLFRPFPC
jgi:hypothetical protein